MNNRSRLAASGWIYPDAGRGGDAAHHLIATKMHDAPEELPEIVAACLAEGEGRTGVILSSEAFHDTPRVDRLAAAFVGHNVRIIVFLRDYLDYLSSWYREDVQTGNVCCDFPNYAILKNKHYAPFLRRWADAFGSDALEIRQYSRSHLSNGSIIDEILLGMIGLPDLNGWEHPGWDHNPSISGNLLFFKRIANNYIDHDMCIKIRSELEELAKIDPSYRSSMYISEDLGNYIFSKYYEDVQAIEAAFGFSLVTQGGGRSGASMPDLTRIRNDFYKIKSECTKNNYLFGKLIDNFAPKFIERRDLLDFEKANF